MKYDLRWPIFIVLINPFITFGQTIVNGTISNNTEWKADGSPYIITQSLTIEPDVTLSVYPGVTIQGKRIDTNDRSDLIVNGLLSIPHSNDALNVYIKQLDVTIKSNSNGFNNSVRFDSVTLITSGITVASITNSKVIADENASGRELISVSSPRFDLRNTEFDGMGIASAALKLHLTNQYDYVFGYPMYEGVIQNCTFKNSNDGVLLDDQDAYYCIYINLIFKYNSFLNITDYFIYNSLKNCIVIDANQNYWGTTDKTEIASRIFKKSTASKITFEFPLFTSPLNPALLAPVNTLKYPLKDEILIGWEASSDPNVVGYRLYKRKSGSFELVQDMGNIRSMLTNDINPADTIYLTVYNSAADGTTDIQEGNESYYSTALSNFSLAKSTSIKSSSFCRDSISVSIAPNIEMEGRPISIQLSNPNGSFITPTIISSIQNTNEKIATIFPDTLKFGNKYRIRLLLGEIVSDTIDVILHNNITSDFHITTYSCSETPYAHLGYTGNAYGNYTLDWKFNDQETFIGESGYAFIQPGGPTTIALQVSKGNCISEVASKTVAPPTDSTALIEFPSLVCPDQDFTFQYEGYFSEREITWRAQNPDGMNITFRGPGPHTIPIGNTPYPVTVRVSILMACDRYFEKEVIIPPSNVPEALIYKITSDSSNMNQVVWYFTEGTTSQFKLYRALDGTGDYQLLTHKDIDDYSELIEGIHVFSYTDTLKATAAPRYRISAMDECGELLADEYDQPVLLTISPTEDQHWRLEWTEYIGHSDFTYYRILKSLNGAPFSLLNELAKIDLSFTDLSSTIYSNVSYQIEILIAAPDASLENGVFNAVKSNTVSNDIILGMTGSSDVHIYPIPFTDYLYIDFVNDVDGNYSIFDVSGKALESGNVCRHTEIDLSKSAPGIYILRFQTNRGIFTQRVIKN